MIRLETHVHTIGTSHCADCPLEDAIEIIKSNGYKAVTFVNHISQKSFDYLGEGDYKKNLDKFYSLQDQAEKVYRQAGFKVFIGAEVGCVIDGKVIEFVVLGLPKEVIYENVLYKLTQKELFELVNKYDGFMYQPHPFRGYVRLGDPRYMHGAESFNGHYHFDNNNEKAKEFCEKNNLIQLSGNDFHHLGQPMFSGIYIPEDINTTREYIDFLKKDEFTLITDEEGYKKALKKHMESKR